MGSTDSSITHVNKLDQDYRLIRRYTSPFYNNSETTVIEHKQTREQFALKQIIHQTHPSNLVKQIQARRLIKHKHLIDIRNYWIEKDVSLCSNLFKINIIFEYHEITLQEYINERIFSNRPFEDYQIYEIIKQMLSAFTFMENNKIVYLMSGGKSIAIAEDNSRVTNKRYCDDNQVYQSRGGERKMMRDLNEKQRSSLADLKRKIAINNDNSFEQKCQQNKVDNHQNKRFNKLIKLFEPFEGLSSAKSLYNLSLHMQVPLHPLLKDSQDQCILSQALIKLQNYFTTILLAVSMCYFCDIDELEIYKNGSLSLELLKSKISRIRVSYPRSIEAINKIFNTKILQIQNKLNAKIENSLKIKQFSMQMKRQRPSFSKQLSFITQNKQNNSFVNMKQCSKTLPFDHFPRVISKKKISVSRY